MSAQPCGCDREAGWVCERHRATVERRAKLVEWLMAASPDDVVMAITEDPSVLFDIQVQLAFQKRDAIERKALAEVTRRTRPECVADVDT